MHSSKYLPLLLVLLLTACGGSHAPSDSAKLDAAMSEVAGNGGSPELVLRVADQTLAQHPADADALIRRGEALTQLGRLGQARDSLHKAVVSQPGNVAALLALGRVELPVDPAAAENDFQAVLKLDNRNAIALNNLGIARDLQGHHVDAEAAYRTALTAQPAMVAAQVNLALCLAIRGQGTEAVALLGPLADAPEATRKIKEDYAAVLAMGGERNEAERILSSNLGANEIGPALDVLAGARTNGR
jgi:Flp pilus assembly protein TadD